MAKLEKRDLHVIFVDIANAFGSVPHEFLWNAFRFFNNMDTVTTLVKAYCQDLQFCFSNPEFTTSWQCLNAHHHLSLKMGCRWKKTKGFVCTSPHLDLAWMTSQHWLLPPHAPEGYLENWRKTSSGPYEDQRTEVTASQWWKKFLLIRSSSPVMIQSPQCQSSLSKATEDTMMQDWKTETKWNNCAGLQSINNIQQHGNVAWSCLSSWRTFSGAQHGPCCPTFSPHILTRGCVHLQNRERPASFTCPSKPFF